MTQIAPKWHQEDISTKLECSRMKIRLVVSLLVAFGLASTARAQSCRIGSGPDFGDGIPYCSDLSSDDAELPQAEQAPQWSSRWGAIVVDPRASDGGVGLASNMESRASAEAAAMKICRETGGSETCHVQVSYVDQCVVVALGDRYFRTAQADTIEEASRLALDLCWKETGHCRIAYTDCSYPVRLR